MAGLLLIGIFVLWLVVAGLIAIWVASRLSSRRVQLILGPLIFFALLVLPFADEIVGKYQLRALCREGAIPRYDEAKARGRSVYMRQVFHPEVPRISVTPSRTVPAWIPITEQTIDWLDVETNEPLLSYKRYTAKGGWLVRTLQISEASRPLTFDPSSCAFNEIPLFKRLGITFR